MCIPLMSNNSDEKTNRTASGTPHNPGGSKENSAQGNKNSFPRHAGVEFADGKDGYMGWKTLGERKYTI